MEHTNEYYRKRIDNVEYANKAVKGCLRKMHIRDYIPGQVIYNLGEYPNKMTIKPTEYDYELIKKLAENGVGLIQIHEEWNDALRIMGADKYSCHDKEGLKEFVSLCHSFGIKVIPYLSSGFFDERDPDYSDKFVTSPDSILVQNYYRYRCCSAASPEWNKYLFDNLRRVMEEYEFDGIFNDMGYDRRDRDGKLYGMEDYDPYIEDLLMRMYSVVRGEYGGIVKLHIGELQVPVTDERIYDYLWVGESCKTSDELLKTINYKPYVIPCPDYKFTNETNGDIYFSRALPFLQFLLRLDGRPINGERSCAPGVEYHKDAESRHFEKIREYYLAHPNGPYVYSEWSDIPDDERLRGKWFEYLKLYKPMVSEDSQCFIDIAADNDITAAPFAPDVHMSVFVNDECYLCISNLGGADSKIVFKESWLNRVTGETVTEAEIPAGGMVFLKKYRMRGIKMKRKIALVLAGLVAATAISGCGNKKGGKNAAEVSYNGDDIYPVSCEDTLTYWVPLNAVLSTTVSNFGESEIGKQLTADTGINVKYIHPTAGGEADQFSVLLASGDLPDIINWDWRAYGADKAMDNDFIIKLNDVIDKYAPNLKKLIDSDPDLEKMLKTDNGSYYAFPFLRGDEELCTYSGPIIRKDWLDKLGMDVPETVDEWETMLKRFKTELNVATPLTCTPADFKNGFFSGAFDAPYSFYIDDNGKAKYGPIEPGFKDFLVTMNKWYNEGLLDKNVATVTDTGALILNESAGATFGFVGGGIGTFLENMQKTNPKFDVVGAPYPVLNKGDRPMIGQKENRYGSAPSSAITTSCKNVELAARFLDYGFTEKGDMLFNFGIEGESYEMKDGKPQFTDKITKDPEGRTIDAMIAQYSLVGSSGIFSQRLDAVNLTRPFEQQQKAVEVWSNTDADKHTIPNIIFTQDESSSMGNSMSEIDTYVSSMVMKFITGVESIDKYDEFVAQIKTFNIDKVLEAYQAAIDRYNNR